MSSLFLGVYHVHELLSFVLFSRSSDKRQNARRAVHYDIYIYIPTYRNPFVFALSSDDFSSRSTFTTPAAREAVLSVRDTRVTRIVFYFTIIAEPSPFTSRSFRFRAPRESLYLAYREASKPSISFVVHCATFRSFPSRFLSFGSTVVPRVTARCNIRRKEGG